jgi:hypothetical protein
MIIVNSVGVGISVIILKLRFDVIKLMRPVIPQNKKYYFSV